MRRETFYQIIPSDLGRGFYFRVRGYGIAFERDLPMLFSERYGHRRVYRFGRWALQFLTPSY